MEIVFIIGIAMSLSEMIKGMGIISVKFVPLLFFLICMIFSIAYIEESAITKGLWMSALGIGIFSSIKNVWQGIRTYLTKRNLMKQKKCQY